jgi:hypothetical protein
MKKSIKVILGLATLWPILYIIIFLSFCFYQVSAVQNGGLSPGRPMFGFFMIFYMHILTMLWVVVLLVVFMSNIFKNSQITKNKKMLWVAVLFFGNIIAAPIYWYLHIWSDSKERVEKRPKL